MEKQVIEDLLQIAAWGGVALAGGAMAMLWKAYRLRVDIRATKALVVRPPDEDKGHAYKWDWPGKPDREFESVVVRVHHDGPLRVVAGVDLVDPVFVYTCAHRTTPLIINIQSLLYASAEDPISIWIFSPQEFKVDYVDARLRLSPARIQRFREESMQKTGMASSLPHPGSHAGREFYRENPDLIP